MNIVAIRQAAETITGTELGAPYAILPFQFEIAMNDTRHLASGYCVTWEQAEQVTGDGYVQQALNIVQDLRLTITKRIFVRNGDDVVVQGIDDIYLALATLLKRFTKDKLDRPDIIQEMRLASLSTPEFIGNGRELVQLIATFRVRYLV